MKKMFAVLLALCLALAVMPALAEESPAGEWYAVAAGITFGNLTLKEDGTAAFLFDGEVSEGTWTAEGNSVTVTIDDQPLTLTMTGAVMSSSEMPYVFMKTPGQATMQDIMAYMENKTLPEGMDEATMEGIITNLAALTDAYSGTDNGQTEAAPETPAVTPDTAPDKTEVADGPVLSILKENFLVREQYGRNKAFYYAVVQNNSEVKLYVANGSLTLLDAGGAEIAAAKYPYPCGSKYLEPGEVSLVAFETEVPEGTQVADHKAEIPAEQPGKWHNPDIELEVTGYEMALDGKGAFNGDGAWVTVKNTESEPLSGIQMAVAFEDENGTPWSLQTFNIYADRLGAGSSYSFWVQLDKNLKEYCEANGVTLTKVEAYAWKELE